MQIGVRDYIDPKAEKYYESYYDVLRTQDFDDKSRLLKPGYGKKILRGSEKRCRFCGKGGEEVTFKKIAHAFPESIGNKTLVSNYECDVCNQYFGNTIENDYAKFFSLYHSIMQIKGKKGLQKCEFKIPCSKRTIECADYCIKISFKEDKPAICCCKEANKQYLDLSYNAITIVQPIAKCSPIAVFKAIVKMAITVMPTEELPLFTDAIKWILESEHKNFYKNRKLLVRYKMIPGFNVTKYPHYILFRRKRYIWNKPYVLFNLTYGCFSLFVEIPRIGGEDNESEFNFMPFPSIPFYTSTEGFWDLSEIETHKGDKHSITLNFDSIMDYDENIKTEIPI